MHLRIPPSQSPLPIEDQTLHEARAEICSVRFRSDLPLLEEAWRIAQQDLFGNVAPYPWLNGQIRTPCLMAGEHYLDQPWTRDAAFNTWFAGAWCFPVLSRNTLLSVLIPDPAGGWQIGGQRWDAVIWSEGLRQSLACDWQAEMARCGALALRNTLRDRFAQDWDSDDGLFRGGACFMDGISGYPDEFAGGFLESGIEDWTTRFPEQAPSSGSAMPCKALSTNLLYLRSLQTLEQLGGKLRLPLEAFPLEADALRQAIRQRFLLPDGRLRYLVDVQDAEIYQEGLGWAFAVLFALLDKQETQQLLLHQQSTPHGIPCLTPTMPRYRLYGMHARHSGTVWPQVNAAWGLACLKAGEIAIARLELLSLAHKAVRDGNFAEIYRGDTGAITGGLQERKSLGTIGDWPPCFHQSWCATGYQGLLIQYLTGLVPSESGLRLRPRLLPGQTHWKFEGLHWQGGTLDIEGWFADGRVRCSVNGEPCRAF